MPDGLVYQAWVDVHARSAGLGDEMRQQVGEAGDEAVEAMDAAMAKVVDTVSEAAAKIIESLQRAAEESADAFDATGKDIAASMSESADEVEVASARMRDSVARNSAEAEGLGDAFNRGTTKAGNALTKLGETMGNFGIPFAGSVSKMGEQIADAETKSDKLGAVLESVGKIATAVGVGALAVFSVESLKMAGNFQQATNMLVTSADLPLSQLKAVRDGILNLSVSTGTSTEQLAAGMYHISSAMGLTATAAQRLDVLKAAAEGARAEGANLDTVSQALAGTMNAFHVAGSGATQMMDEMLATVSSGDLRMQDLASSLGNVAPLAAKAGLSYAQIGGAIATMTSQNMSAQRATQDLNNLIRGIQAPNNVAIAEMQQLGINSNDLSKNLGKEGLTGTIQEMVSTITEHMGPAGEVILNAFKESQSASADLQTMLDHMTPSVRALAEQFEAGKISLSAFRKEIPTGQGGAELAEFDALYNKTKAFNDQIKAGNPAAQTFTNALKAMTGGATGMNTVMMLSGTNAAAFNANVKDVADSADSAGTNVNNWSIIQHNFNFELDQAKDAVSKLAIEFGTDLIPKVQTAIGVITDIVTWFEKHQIAAEALAAVVGGVLVAGIVAFTASLIAANAALIATMLIAAEILVPLAAIGVGVYELYTNWGTVWGEIQTLTSTVTSSIMAVINTAWTWIKNTTSTVFDAIRDFLTAWWPVVLGIFTFGIGLVVGEVIQHWSLIETTTKTVFGAVEQFFQGLWSSLTSGWDGFLSFITGAWTGFTTLSANVWHGIVNTISSAWGGLVTTAENIWSEVKAAFTTGIDDVIKTVDDIFIGPIKSVFGHFGVNIPLIPLIGAASGTLMSPGRVGAGFATKGPTVVVGEGDQRHPEVVIPTDPAHRDNAVKLMGHAANIMGLASGGTISYDPRFSPGTNGTVAYDSATAGGWNPLSAIAGVVRSFTSAALDPLLNSIGSHLESLLGSMQPAFIGSAAAGLLKSAISGVEAWIGGHQTSSGPGASGTVYGPPSNSSAAANQALGQAMAASYGWTGAEWVALNNVAMRESGWSSTAQNPTSSAYGIAQNINGLAGYGPGGNTPAVQIAWMLNYIKARYGDPIAAWAHELSAGWYASGGILGRAPGLPVNTFDTGGYLPSGWSLAGNFTGSPEKVPNPRSTSSAGAGPTFVFSPTYAPTGVGVNDVLPQVATMLDAQFEVFVREVDTWVGAHT